MRTPAKIFLAFLLALSTIFAKGQQAYDELEGSWQGVLHIGAVELRLVFNLSLVEDTGWAATMDSPDQGAMGVPLGDLKLSGDSIRIEAPNLLGYYIGKITSPSNMEGEWHQAGRILELNLEKRDGAFVLNRPQEPQPPYPYRELEVTFQNTRQGFTLGGTLSVPEGEGPFPAAILVSGSGSQNRDEEIFGHKPFKVIADRLTRNGIAVLRYDDRGVNASGGNPAGATTGDLAQDARAAMDFLSMRADIDPSKTGIIGHSEGALIAFILASSSKDFAYVVSLAGPGVDGKKILLDQSDHIARLSGAGEDILEDNRKVMTRVYDLMIANESHAEWEELALEFMSEYYTENLQGDYTEEEIEQGRENLMASISEQAYAWFRYFVMLDPAPLLAAITCPVLALNGEKDCQVLPEANINAIQNGLQSTGNNDSKALILTGLNHLFQNCETGLPNEYGVIEETFDTETLDMIVDWILTQVE